MTDPQVPESKRYCSSCGELVGQGRDRLPGRPEGFCSKCGAHFSFTPKLVAGDLVGGQYEVLGCLAHGGLGWIYLARDRNVSDRWVVLKGLLDTGDADAMAAAMAERRFLATVEHPNIVRIYNFVEHGGSGYIVMEHVGGRSLKEILLDHRQRHEGASLPLPQVIAYGLESLRALGYLHGQGLVYCDFKPDNVIQSEEQLRLIDMGGVRRLDDDDSPIYGTVGYQAPEIAETGPTSASDLYTVGRTMAVLAFDFKGYTGTYRHVLPDRAQIPLLERYESFDRLLRRATHLDPDRRFWSAEEMAEQLTGVLREVLSATDQQPRPALSKLFGPELNAAITEAGEPLTARAVVAALPSPLVAATDPAHGYLAGLAGADPGRLTALLAAAPVSSAEVELRRARAHLDNNEAEYALSILRELDAGGTLAGDWRLEWHQALIAAATGEAAEAIALFDDLYGLLPGEAAPRLGLALCLELDGDLTGAAYHYEAIWRTDHAFVSAAFGLARAFLARGDRAGAVGVLDSVLPGSSHRFAAQLTAVAMLVRGRPPAELSPAVLLDAGARFEALGLDGEHKEHLALEILGAALASLPVSGGAGAALNGGGRLLGSALTEPGLRQGLEHAYRRLARLSDSAGLRSVYVDRANSVRPKTLI
jgi:serine/threonine-protein kinase PknG